MTECGRYTVLVWDEDAKLYQARTVNETSVERKYASAPFRSPGGYEPLTRWEIVEMVRAFGLDVMDDVLPYVIDNDYEVVYAMLPNDETSMQLYRASLFDFVYPRSKSSYIGIGVTNYVNTLNEFIEMLVYSNNNLFVPFISNELIYVNLQTQVNWYAVSLRRNVLQKVLQHGLVEQV